MTPHAGTGFRYAMNPHRGQPFRATRCSRIERSVVPQSTQYRGFGRLGCTPFRPRFKEP